MQTPDASTEHICGECMYTEPLTISSFNSAPHPWHFPLKLVKDAPDLKLMGNLLEIVSISSSSKSLGLTGEYLGDVMMNSIISLKAYEYGKRVEVRILS